MKRKTQKEEKEQDKEIGSSEKSSRERGIK